MKLHKKSNRVMEAETIEKNEASLKSFMSKEKKIIHKNYGL